jgi:hypothetical protein
MADGTTNPISEVQVGDWVIAEDPESGERGARQVTHLWVHQDTIIDLEIDGHDVATTEDHPFWNHTDQEWQAASALDVGDLVLTSGGATLTVDGLDWGSARTTTAYNLTVDDIHTYYVLVGDDEVLVHNICSKIDADPRLVREARRAGGSNQSGIDSLTTQLANGNLNPGLGTKTLAGTDIWYARHRDGARVYFQMNGDNVVIVGKSNKHNQSRVISILEELYG